MSGDPQARKDLIVQDWLPRYTGMRLDEFGDYVLLTNFKGYVDTFARRFECEVRGIDHPMQAASNSEGLTIVNFGIGTANAATIGKTNHTGTTWTRTSTPSRRRSNR